MDILYDLDQLRQEFAILLNDFSNGVRAEKIRHTVGKPLLKYVNHQINQILSRLEADFSLVVIGDFKRGKSTLINALLQMPVVTTDVTTETVTINQICYGDPPQIQACLADGGRVKLASEDLKKERLETILKQLAQPVSHLVIETPIPWLKGLHLVDTPGTGDIFKRFDRQVHDYLLKADAVIFVVSALSPLSEGERTFLQLSVLPQDFPKIYFVLNMMDSIYADQDAERLIKSMQRKIDHFFPSALLFGVSALDEVCRIQSLPRPNPSRADKLAGEFEQFRMCLQESILLNRDLIQIDRATDHFDQMLQEVETKMQLFRDAMQASQHQLSQGIAQCESETSELFRKVKQHQQTVQNDINEMCEHACTWMNDFIQRLVTEAIQTLPKYRLEDIRRHFHFFLTDSLCKAINRCVNAHQPIILESVNRAQKAISKDIQVLTMLDVTKADVTKATFHDQLWTDLDTLQLLASYTPFKLVAGLFTKQRKDLGELQQVANYQQRIESALPELKQSVMQEIHSIYSRIAVRIEQQIESAYRQEIEASLLAMQQAQDLYIEGEQKVNLTTEAVQEVSVLLEETRSTLQSFKQKLWLE